MALVSIVIPIYNVEKYLKEAINSIINQTYKNIEVILVNDGSVDSCAKIIEGYRSVDSRIRVITQENRGVSEARNSGFKVASGKYIYFFDSDDILELNTIQECLNVAVKDDLDLVVFDAISSEDGTNEEIDLLKYRLTNEESDVSIHEGSYFLSLKNYRSPVWLKFIKLDILKKNNITFYPRIIHEDELFTPILLSHCKKVKYINKIFFKRRMRKDSIMMSKRSEKNVVGNLTVARELLKYSFDFKVEEKINNLIKRRLFIIIQTLMELDLLNKYKKIIIKEFYKYLKLITILKLTFNIRINLSKNI